MTLQSSGAISLGNVNTELGRSSTAAISLGETAVRALAGVSSGAIALSNLYGKSNVSFSPVGGTSAGTAQALSDLTTYPGTASVTITCNQSATWTWTRSGSFGNASVTNGGTGTSITFSMSSSNTAFRSTVYTVSATAGGVTRYWSVQLQTETLA